MVRPPTPSLLRVSSPSRAAPGMLASATDALFRDSRVATIVLFLPPALLLFTLFVVLPIAEAGWYSAFSWNGFGRPTNFVGPDNYAKSSSRARSASFQQHPIILVAAVAAPLALTLALMLAENFAARSRCIYSSCYVGRDRDRPDLQLNL